MAARDVVVAQSGGPTCVINNSLRGIVETCRRDPKTFGTVFAGNFGIEGVLKEELIDLSATILGEARKNGQGSRSIVADVRRLPFPTGFFGSVVSISTLDHFDNPGDIEASLAEIHRVLSPGGCLVVTMDNPQNPLVALRNHLPWGWLHRIGLVPYYVGATLDRRGLVDTLERVGFEVTDVDALQHVPRAPTVAAAGLVSRLGSAGAERAFLGTVAAFERVRAWPSRFRTGYFVAARGIRR